MTDKNKGTGDGEDKGGSLKNSEENKTGKIAVEELGKKEARRLAKMINESCKENIIDGKEEGQEVDNLKNINENIAEKVQERVEQEREKFGDAAKIEGSGEITRKFISQCLKENQRGDGMVFSKLFKDKFLFNHSLGNSGKWMIFENHYWKMDILKEHLTAVEEVAKVYLQESVRVGTEIIELEKKDLTDGIKNKI